MKGRTVSAVRVVAFHAVVSVVFTLPLAWHLGDGLPLGTEPTGTVALFNLWTLRWGARHVVPFGSGYWDAPIFFPAHGTFALSEPQPLTAAMFSVARWFGGDLAGYAIVLLVGLTLAGVGAYVLARRLGADPVPAALAGVAAQGLPFVFDQLGVLQLTMIWPVFFALAAIVAWASQPAAIHAVAFAASVAALVMTCGTHALVFALTVILAAPLLIRGSWWDQVASRAGSVAVAAGLLIAVTAPLVVAQQQRLAGYAWATATVRAGSADWRDWWWGGRSWPGIVLLVLAVAGLWVGRHAPTTRFFAAMAAASFAISLGSRLSVFGWRPWDALADAVPALARVRSPWRAAVITQIAAVALAVPAIQNMWTARRRLVRTALPVAMVAGIVSGPIGSGNLLATTATRPRAVVALDELSDSAPVVLLPFATGLGAETFQPTTIVMNHLLDTGHPLVNGYSGFFPPDHRTVRAAVDGFPDQSSLEMLTRRGVRYALVDPAWLKPRRDELTEQEIRVLVDDAAGILLLLPEAPEETGRD